MMLQCAWGAHQGESVGGSGSSMREWHICWGSKHSWKGAHLWPGKGNLVLASFTLGGLALGD